MALNKDNGRSEIVVKSGLIEKIDNVRLLRMQEFSGNKVENQLQFIIDRDKNKKDFVKKIGRLK